MPQPFSSETAAVPPRMRQGWRRLDWSKRPAEIAETMALREGFVWLDSAVAVAGSVSILAAEPTEILTGSLSRDWPRIAAALEKGRDRIPDLPPCPGDPAGPAPAGGLFGWVGFDGEFVLGSYPHVLLYDHGTRDWFEFGQISTFAERHPGTSANASPALHFQPRIPRTDFLAQVTRAQEYIAAGDIYQVNLSVPWHAPWPAGADFLRWYENLRAVSPAPHAACLHLQGTTVLSASPELFLKISGSTITTRPIKGTRPRFPADLARDAASARELLASPKERAELLMITDLERNDLGQVCEFGSIQVPDLWRVEGFAQVHHLVSTVTGKLRRGVSQVDAFRACFPGGSISGAPKKRALEVIHELEPHPRGLYTGAIGYFGFDGESQWSIAIRTAVQSGSAISFHVGSGIVADSIPQHEWEETLHKASGMLAASGR